MKLRAPRIVRRGVVIRVAGGTDVGRTAVASSFVDLRFEPGYVERWLGAGSARTDVDPADKSDLLRWGEIVADEMGLEVFYELHREFPAPSREEFDEAETEVVVIWNATDLGL